jgi:hypothetical protein
VKTLGHIYKKVKFPQIDPEAPRFLYFRRTRNRNCQSSVTKSDTDMLSLTQLPEKGCNSHKHYYHFLAEFKFNSTEIYINVTSLDYHKKLAAKIN